ncbi:LYR motif containing protein 1 [Elysia marginata]|uniref:LYR motif containing protein 1 n=1 Tax=Elysia marginata TaxID=1093978 RepID=A0AAV4H8H1_9GAST|nr:LYR motif containing protein 1 [Elysia marginata]
MSAPQRLQVLSLYRKALRLSKTWVAASAKPDETHQERTYIQEEARKLFREHKHETSESRIKEYIREGETRLGLAQHYGTPYPRLMNMPPNVLPFKGSPKYKRDKRVMRQATPVYLQSTYNNDSSTTASVDKKS